MICNSLSIGSSLVGVGHPTFFIAEIGSNHNQDFNLACKSIEIAAQSGANAVKFQTFKASNHYSSRAPGFGYLSNTNTFDLIERLELDRSWQPKLKQCADDNGVHFLSSPCDFDAVDSLEDINVEAYKVASFDLTDDHLISYMASKGKPLILSTGMAHLRDIEFALDAAKRADNDQIILLQCTSLYPAPVHLSNLSAMNSMRKMFGTIVGYSDHTLGNHISITSVAMGASIIEKHFTLDKSLPGPDHSFAIEPYELSQLIEQIRDVESSFGDGLKNGPRPDELEMYQKGRRSIHANCNISKGQIIENGMLSVKRPGLGILPMYRAFVLGREAKRDIKFDEWITWDML